MITAIQAMERAIEDAVRGETASGMLWLDIARELRKGSVRESPNPETTFKDKRPGDAIEGDGDRCSSCGYFLRFDKTRGVWVHTRTDMQVCPVGRPGPDDTVVHGFATPE